MKVILDTNIFISGIFWKGSSYNILNFWKEGRLTLATSLKCVSEIVKVLKDFKIKLSDESIKEWVEFIIQNSEIVEPKEKVDVVKDDPDDNKVIECALASGSEYILTYDNHLLKLNEFRGIKIIKPEELLKLF